MHFSDSFDQSKSIFFFYFTKDKVLRANARYLNDRSVVVEIYRETNNQKVTDVLVSASLNTSKILHTRIHWRPALIQDVKVTGK